MVGASLNRLMLTDSRPAALIDDTSSGIAKGMFSTRLISTRVPSGSSVITIMAPSSLVRVPSITDPPTSLTKASRVSSMSSTMMPMCVRPLSVSGLHYS